MKPIPAAAMTPTPPSWATAEASPAREIPTPIPPWMMGTLISISPMRRGGGLMVRLVSAVTGRSYGRIPSPIIPNFPSFRSMGMGRNLL